MKNVMYLALIATMASAAPAIADEVKSVSSNDLKSFNDSSGFRRDDLTKGEIQKRKEDLDRRWDFSRQDLETRYRELQAKIEEQRWNLNHEKEFWDHYDRDHKNFDRDARRDFDKRYDERHREFDRIAEAAKRDLERSIHDLKEIIDAQKGKFEEHKDVADARKAEELRMELEHRWKTAKNDFERNNHEFFESYMRYQHDLDLRRDRDRHDSAYGEFREALYKKIGREIAQIDRYKDFVRFELDRAIHEMREAFDRHDHDRNKAFADAKMEKVRKEMHEQIEEQKRDLERDRDVAMKNDGYKNHTPEQQQVAMQNGGGNYGNGYGGGSNSYGGGGFGGSNSPSGGGSFGGGYSYYNSYNNNYYNNRRR